MALKPTSRSAQGWRTSMWTWPVASGALAFVVANVMTAARPMEGSTLGGLWRGGPSAAISILQSVATSVMTATTLIFSLTVLALQLASQQFSPRLLRRFARDAATKRVLSVLTVAFVFSTTAMTGIDEEGPVPVLVVVVALLLGIASFAAILAFVSYMVRALRVDTMMLGVHDDTDDAIATVYPAHDAQVPDGRELGLDSSAGRTVTATRSGFVQVTDVQALVACLAHHDAVARIEVRAGDHVVRGTPLATAWAPGGATPGALPDVLVEGIRNGITLQYERTLDQDAAFGFRQLEDIAVKAMSPAVNDPVTAAHAVGHMGDLLVQLTARRLGPTLHLDDVGVGRLVVPDRDLRYYLDLACAQLRRFASSEPTVLNALLRMLRDVAVSCRDEHQRDEVRRAADGVVASMDPSVVEIDAASVLDHRRRVDLALAGDVVAAFADRTGETRSM